MELTTTDIQHIKKLLAELPTFINEEGYPYALGATQYWLKHIVAMADKQSEQS